MRLFEVNDKTGRIIYLTEERWRHILFKHPNLISELETIKRTLLYPSCILQDPRNLSIHSYFGHCKNKPEPFLAVVVKYINGEGFILTSFYTDQTK
ncbi:MAG: hypothetical protein AABX70_05205 [Nanoarchaeota archaeon]